MKILVIDDEMDLGANPSSAETGQDRFADTVRAALPGREVTLHFIRSYDLDRKEFSVEFSMLQVEEHADSSDAILLDVMFGGQRDFGLKLLSALSQRFLSLPVVMMTAVPRRAMLHEAMHRGAVDYLVKPVLPKHLARTLSRFAGVPPEYWLIGQSDSFFQSLEVVARAAEGGRSSVFLLGESGTGKELLARYLHRHGIRHTMPFSVLHIPAMNAELQESRLFGHSKGAFTGAQSESEGEFVRANGGVVFLDEIANVPPDIQARLLRVTESGEVARAGDGRTSSIDIQIVSATNANIIRQVKDGVFRDDLWSRLSAMPVAVPALRDRRSDIPLLIRHLMRVESLRRGLQWASRISPHALDQMVHRPWDGNVRALRNLVLRLFDLADGPPNDETLKQAVASESAREDMPPSPESHLEQRESSTHESTVEDPARSLTAIRLQELALLMRALQLTRSPLNGPYNRSKAAAWLKGKGTASTIQFDRWFEQLWGCLDEEARVQAGANWPEQLAALTYKGSPPKGD